MPRLCSVDRSHRAEQSDSDGREAQIRRVTVTIAGPRRRRGHGLARVAIAVALTVGLAAAIALPDIDGVTRAADRARGQADRVNTARRATASAGRPRGRPRADDAVLTISPGADTTSVPASYFGLSTEYSELPLFERNMPVFERVLSLLHVPGNGPLVLRIGGDSADHSFWAPKPKRMPGWAFAVTPAFLRAAENPRATRPRAADRRPQPGHRQRPDRRHLGPRGRDVAAAREHRRVRGRQRARHLRPSVLGGDGLAVAARGAAAAARPDPRQLRRRLQRLRAGARRGRARRAADRAGGRAPQRQPALDIDVDRR